MAERLITHTFTDGHLFGAVGGGARGFKDAEPRFGNLQGKFECLDPNRALEIALSVDAPHPEAA